MTSPFTPDQAKSWFSTIYYITEKSTPITLVFLLIIGGIFAWYMLKELGATRVRTLNVYNRLLIAKDEQLAQAMEFAESLAKVSLHCNVPLEEVMPKRKITINPGYPTE